MSNRLKRPSVSSDVLRITAALLLASVVAPSSAYAYIDPLSGSAILQALAAGVLAGLFMMKSYWHRAKEALRRFKDRLSR
jgi:hypothetical protein